VTKLIINNARIIAKDEVITGSSVLIEDGIIKIIGPDIPLPVNTAVLNAAGSYLSPGFIDLHTHGRCFSDAMDSSHESLSTIAKDLLKHGVTGFLITTQSAPLDNTLAAIKNAVSYIANPDPEGALPLGIYLEGPFLSDIKKGAQQLNKDDSIDLNALRLMLKAGEGNIRVIALAPELPGAVSAIKEIREQGIVVAAAHTNSSYSEAIIAIQEGLSLATHTFNGMRSLSHREPSVVGACLTDDRITCEVIADGIHLHPAIVKLIYLAKGTDKMVLVSDSVAATGIPDGEYEYGGRKFTVKHGAICLSDGTLAGSALSLDTAVRNVMTYIGCSLPQAVRMATETPARVIGQNDLLGNIETEKRANLILFDDSLSIKSALLAGNLIDFGL